MAKLDAKFEERNANLDAKLDAEANRAKQAEREEFGAETAEQCIAKSKHEWEERVAKQKVESAKRNAAFEAELKTRVAEGDAKIKQRRTEFAENEAKRNEANANATLKHTADIE